MQLCWPPISSVFYSFFLLFTLLFHTACYGQSGPNAPTGTKRDLLTEYVQTPDPAFEFKLETTIPGEGYTAHILRMNSQRWLSEAQIKDPLWWHWVTIIVPDQVKTETGLLFIGGGDRDTKPEKTVSPLIVIPALSAGAVTVHLHNVPCQPQEFVGDPQGPRYEDAIIAYGWRKFMEGGARDEDAVWLSRLPMTKAAVRAMDAAQQYCQTSLSKRLSRFVVAGASKRGWTTWTTAVADSRVVAIAPIVIDLLNVEPSFQHHWRAYGAWSPAIDDYQNEGIMDWTGSREYKRLLEITEPYSFRRRLSLPKLLINAASDEFFLPDSWQFYWKDLPGKKWLRYVPNAGHGLDQTNALETLAAFFRDVVENRPQPGFDWKISKGVFTLKIDPKNPPTAIYLWSAANTEARDFRLPVIQKTWEKQEIPLKTKATHRIVLQTPEKGFKAYFVELVFSDPGRQGYHLTTGVTVLPEVYPYGPFQSQTPKGSR